MTANYSTSRGATHRHHLHGFRYYLKADSDADALLCANERFTGLSLFDLFQRKFFGGTNYRWCRCADERHFRENSNEQISKPTQAQRQESQGQEIIQETNSNI